MEAEAKVLEGLREQNLSLVRIRFDNDGEMDLLELTKKEKVDERARLMELLLTNGYQQLVVNTQEGKVVHFEKYTKTEIEMMVLKTSDLLIQVSPYSKKRGGCSVLNNAKIK